ncbi:cytochrome P450 [Exophiala viscosa]|uniref:Cytochrome P450 n=1 Tax=Exophiala viscosa TaxID=2486360 RepID=A0AAN6DYI0_9EURO|nr:cytochrome P450 [Exophiala viscosa]KAI1626325.1 cytochrome P450 [Exophiala viscosa]
MSAGIPILGNLLQVPPYHSWLKFKEWSDQYGSIFRMNIAGRKHVVLSTEKIANDLLRERGSLYSSREYLPFASELLSNNLRPLFLPYNDLWRRGRKLMHQLTMPVAADSYQPVQEHESVKLLAAMLREPTRYERWLEQYASGVVFRIGFGRWIETGREKEFLRIVKVGKEVERVGSPGAYLVDTLPFLKYIPTTLAPFKQEARRLRAEELSLFRQLQNDVRQEMRNGSAVTSFTKTFLENQKAYELSDDEGAYVIGTLFEAGTGTTAAAMMSFCLAMCLHPEWQKKIQEEVDSVAGSRMPDFEDIPQLPTVRAVIKEVMRWRPVTAGGVPHQLIKDDEYQGYLFEAGTVFHANQWAIHRDPELYPDPEAFRPERWLSSEFPQTYREPLNKFPNLQNFSCFGFGRRICPGQNIAERSMNILTARIAWALDLQRKVDAEGKVLPIPEYDYIAGFNVQPRHFDFEIVARSPERAEAVAVALREAKAGRLP